MAAATAVTTVAPAIANAADSRLHEKVSAGEVNAKIKEALATKYANPTEDGLGDASVNVVKDYMNSRYAVLLHTGVELTAGDIEKYGLATADGAYSSLLPDAAKFEAAKKAEEVAKAKKEEATNKFEDAKKAEKAANDAKTAAEAAKTAADEALNQAPNDQAKKDAAEAAKKALEEATKAQEKAARAKVAAETAKTAAEQAAEKATKNREAKEALLKSKYSYVVTDAEKVIPLIEKLMATPDKGKSVPTSVEIVDKGIDGTSAYRTTKNKHLVKTVKDADTQMSISELEAQFKGVKNSDSKFVEDVITDGDGFKVVLTSGETLKFHVGDDAVDIKKAVAKDGQSLDLTIDLDTLVVHNTQSVCDEVVKFAPIANKGDVEVKVDVPTVDSNVFELNDVELTSFDLGTVYTKAEGYTQAGADLINKLIRAKRGPKDEYSFNYAGTNYVLANDKQKPVKKVDEAKDAVHTNPIDAKIDKVGDMYLLRLNVDVLDKNDKDRFKTLQFKFEGKTQADLARVLADLKGDIEVVVGKFVKLAGPNRYETAIEVSKERFGYHDADTVVIVGGNALMDGLSAAPLAAAKNAPVLLADAKTGLNNATLNEIDRVTSDLKRKTVYIVGGENSVPKSVEKQLEDKFGAVVVRLSGDNRYDTSLEVASRLVTDGHQNKELFVVGGDGAADAMSVSAVAAKKVDGKTVSPILVVPKEGLKRTQREFVVKKDRFLKGYVIGGETTVSTQVFRDLEQIIAKNPQSDNATTNRVERVSGVNRYATNVAVIKRFYNGGKAVMGLDVTSGKNQYLVDAQTAGAFAAENGAAILLTDAKLTKDQKDLLGDMKLKAGVYQVGGVVSSDVMKEVVDVLGL